MTYQTVQQWETEPDPDNPEVLSTAPKRSRMPEVAKMLGVTEEWLRTGIDDTQRTLDPIAAQLIDIYQKLPPEGQELLVQQANGLFTALNPETRGKGNPFAGKAPPASKRRTKKDEAGD